MNFREATFVDIPALSDPRRMTREMYESYLGGAGEGRLCEDGGEVAG